MANWIKFIFWLEDRLKNENGSTQISTFHAGKFSIFSIFLRFISIKKTNIKGFNQINYPFCRSVDGLSKNFNGIYRLKFHISMQVINFNLFERVQKTIAGVTSLLLEPSFYNVAADATIINFWDSTRPNFLFEKCHSLFIYYLLVG